MKILPCRDCGTPVTIPDKYAARVKTTRCTDCYDKAKIANLPDDAKVPGTSVTMGQLRRWAEEVVDS